MRYSCSHFIFGILAILVFAACGNDEKQVEDITCKPGHFGHDCKPCTCQNGTCRDGVNGDGKCSACQEGYFGEDCAKLGECKHGTPSLGIDGTGQCASCEVGWDIAKNCTDTTTDYMADKADNLYKVVVIGEQTWMAQNMAYQGTEVACHANTKEAKDFIKNYGCLYLWNDAQKVCPNGWSLPTETDYADLLDFVENNRQSESSFLALIAHSGWYGYGNKGGDDFGFGALPAGYYNSDGDSFGSLETNATFWTSTPVSSVGASVLEISSALTWVRSNFKDWGFSVRCLKD